MKLDIYGKFQIEVNYENGRWQVYKLGNGYRIPAYDIVIPSEIASKNVINFLDDIFHEASSPGTRISKI